MTDCTDSLKCTSCGQPIDAGPRFRQGGPTGNLCWICARLYHSVQREMADIREPVVVE